MLSEIFIKFLIYENASENIVCKMAAILSRGMSETMLVRGPQFTETFIGQRV